MAQKNLRSPRAVRPSDIGSRVRRRREELGLSQARVACDARVGRRTLQRVERGALPSADTVWRLERSLGFEPGSLVPGWKTAGSLHQGSVGARIRERRQACRLSLTQVGTWIGMSASSLSRFERGIPRIAEVWDEIVDHRLVEVLGFRSVDRFEQWLNGEIGAPPGFGG